MRRVIIESPFGTTPSGLRATPEELARNVAYARRAMRWCLDRGYSPYASHLLYPQVYDDATPEERKAGIAAGLSWSEVADVAIVFEDYGTTAGMLEGIERHQANGLAVEFVRIGVAEEHDPFCSVLNLDGPDLPCDCGSMA